MLFGLRHLEMRPVRAWFFYKVLATKGCSLERECPLVNTEDLVSVLQQKAETSLNTTLWSTRYMCCMVQRFSLRAQKQALEKETSWPGFEDESWMNVVLGIVHPVLSSRTCSSGWLFWVMAGRDLLERRQVALHENQAPPSRVWQGRVPWNKRPKLAHHFWS